MHNLVSTLVVSLVALAASAARGAIGRRSHGTLGRRVTAPMGQIEFEVDVVREASGALVATYGQKATACAVCR